MFKATEVFVLSFDQRISLPALHDIASIDQFTLFLFPWHTTGSNLNYCCLDELHALVYIIYILAYKLGCTHAVYNTDDGTSTWLWLRLRGTLEKTSLPQQSRHAGLKGFQEN